jgi:hypothetical protein
MRRERQIFRASRHSSCGMEKAASRVLHRGDRGVGPQWFIEAFQTLFDRDALPARFDPPGTGARRHGGAPGDHGRAPARDTAETVRPLSAHISLTSEIVATAGGILPDPPRGSRRRPRP